MTPNPVTWPPDASVRQAAQRTREQDIGNALVAEGDRLRNIVTDWDIVVRGGAERDDLPDVHQSDVCGERVVTAELTEPAEATIARMRENAIRRIAVVENGRPVGVLFPGDAALERDPNSVLGDISAAAGNV